MGLEQIPSKLRTKFLFDERDHACAILATDFPSEFRDLLDCMSAFTLKKSAVLTPGGGRSPIPIAIDGFLTKRGWTHKSFDIKIEVDDGQIPIPTHSIDNFKNRIGVEVEWNNKTEFYDRDLNNFRLLKELRVLSVGVIITRQSELQAIFDEQTAAARDVAPCSLSAWARRATILIPETERRECFCLPSRSLHGRCTSGLMGETLRRFPLDCPTTPSPFGAGEQRVPGKGLGCTLR